MLSYEMRQRNGTTLLNVPFSDDSFFNSDSNTTFISQLPSAYISQFHLLNLSTSLGVSYMSTTFSKMSLDDSAFDSWFEPNSFFTPFFNLKYDNMDEAYFAKHGLYASMNTRFYWDPKNGENNN